LRNPTPAGAAQSGAVSGGLTPEALAAALQALSPEDKARLAALLLGQPTPPR